MDLALVPCARLALRRLAANADSRVDDPWPVVVDRMRLIRIELLDLSAWAQSAASRTAVVITASRSPRRLQGAGRTALIAHIAVFAFGTELVPLNEWKTAGGGGRDLALRRLLPLAEEQVRALTVCHQQHQQHEQQSRNKRARTDDSTVESSNSKAAATRSTRTASRSRRQMSSRRRRDTAPDAPYCTSLLPHPKKHGVLATPPISRGFGQGLNARSSASPKRAEAQHISAHA